MPKFSFRLASLLQLRAAERDERQLELADAQRNVQHLEEGRQNVLAAIADLRRDARTAADAAPVDLDRLREAYRYGQVLDAERGALERQIAAVQIELAARHEALITAQREVRVLEQLRDTRRASHLAAENSAEAKLLDEIAARSFIPSPLAACDELGRVGEG